MLEVLRFYQGSFERAGFFERNDYAVLFRYDETYLGSAHAHPLSLSLPLRSKAFAPSEFQGFFEGLVPEGKTRIELAHRIGASPSHWLDLLEELNCECIGALVFKRDDASLDEYSPSITPFLATRFDELAKSPAVSAAKAAALSRLSLSGAQAKIGLMHFGSDPLDNWFVPHGTAPSTHIVKIPDENHPYLALNEYTCMEAARTCGLPTAECFIVPGRRPLFATQRFDRTFEDGCTEVNGIQLPVRLHQEDFCQAAGLPSYGKYEMEQTDNYVASANRTIERFSSNAIKDKTEFARQIAFDYLIGNCDNHLKNYSLQYSTDWNSVSLAPAYDLVCTTILGYSRLMGISIGDTRNIDEITQDDWKLFAEDLRMPEELVLEILSDMRNILPTALHNATRSANTPEAQKVAASILEDAKPRLATR